MILLLKYKTKGFTLYIQCQNQQHSTQVTTLSNKTEMCSTSLTATKHKQCFSGFKKKRVFSLSCKYCGKLGAETSVREMWKAIHRMAGIVRSDQIRSVLICSRVPILESDGRSVIVDIEKASEFENRFRAVHSGDNLEEEGLRRPNETLKQQMHKLDVNEHTT